MNVYRIIHELEACIKEVQYIYETQVRSPEMNALHEHLSRLYQSVLENSGQLERFPMSH